MRVNNKKQKKDIPMTLAPKFQFGGFPSLFSENIDFSNYSDVQNALTSDPTVGGNFAKAFSKDDPSLIGRSFMRNLSGAIATNNNPLLTADDPVLNGMNLADAAEATAKGRTFLGIGKKKAKEKAIKDLQGKLDDMNAGIVAQNQSAAEGIQGDIFQGAGQANALANFLSNFQFQQGGKPFESGQLIDMPMTDMETYYSTQGVNIDLNSIFEIRDGIKSIKDNKTGRKQLDSVLSTWGIPNVKSGVRDLKEYWGMKDKSAKITSSFLDRLANDFTTDLLHSSGHTQSFQQGGSINQLGYSDGSPYGNMPAIPIQGNNITMASTGRPLMAYPNVGQPRIMQPYSGTHIFPGASNVVEMPIMKNGGLINTNILTEKGDPWEYQKVNGEWRTRKKGNKTWITAKGKPLAAIEARYDPLATQDNTALPNPFLQYLLPRNVQQTAAGQPATTPTAQPTVDRGYIWEASPYTLPMGAPISNYGVRDIANISPQSYFPSIQQNQLVHGQLPYGYGVTDQFGNLMQPVGPRPQVIPQVVQAVEPRIDYSLMLKKEGGLTKGKKKRLYQEGGAGAVGAQLEQGELFASTNADIFDTAALEKHSKMKKDKVTDVLAEGDYVFSALDRMKITRKEAEDMSFGMGGVLYKEGEIPKMPIEMTAADLLKEDEKEVKLTDYVDRIRKKYVIKDSEDVFDKKTNDFNRQSRGMYLSGAAVINEKKKKGEKSAGYASTFDNPFAEDITSTANSLNSTTSDARSAAPQLGPDEFRQGGVPNYGGGGIWEGIVKALPGMAGMIQGFGALRSARNNREDIQNALLQDRKDINQVAGSQSQYQGLSTAAALAGLAAQDPRVDAPNYDTTQLDASIRRVPRSLFDYQSARLAAASKPYMDQAFQNSGSFQQGVNAYAPVAAANAGSMANLGLNEVNQNISMENQYRAQKQGYADRQILGDVNAQNQTRSNVNQLVAGAGNTLSGGIANQGNIESNRLNSLRNNNFQQVANTVDWRQAKNDAWGSVISNWGNSINSFFSTPLSKNSGTTTAGGTDATSRPGWQAPTMPSTSPTINQPPLMQLRPIQPVAPRYDSGLPYNQSGFGNMSGFVYDPETDTWIRK